MTVVVQSHAGEIVVRSPRIERMIRYLAERERDLAGLHKGSLVFNFAGARGLTAEVVEKLDLSSR